MVSDKPFQKVMTFLKNSIGDVKASVCFLYIQYCKQNVDTNNELLKNANQSLNQFLKLNKKELSDICDGFEEFSLEANDYSSVALQYIEFYNSKTKRDVLSNRYVCELVDKLLGIKPNDIVFDMGSGYGNFLGYVSMMERNKFIKPILIGQETNPDLVDVSKMLLEMCGANYTIENVNSLSSDVCPAFTKGYVFPSFGLRYEPDLYNSFIQKYPDLFTGRVSSPWLFLFNALSHMKANGRIVAIINDSSLFQSADANIRKYLIDNGLLEGIISLPSNTFSGMSIKTDIIVLSNGNTSFKAVDGEKVLEGLPLKGLTSHEAAIDIYNAYIDTNVRTFKKEDITTLDCCLTLNSLTTRDIYQGMDDLVNLTDVVDILKGCSLTAANFERAITTFLTGTEILTSSDIDEKGIINFDTMKNIVEDKRLEKYYAHNGDIILSSKSTKVKVAVFHNDYDDHVVVTGAMIILRPKTKVIDSTFLKIFFDSKKGMELLNSIQKGSVITTISTTNLATLKIPCPDIKIQKRIANEYQKTLDEYQIKKKEVNALEEKLTSFYDDYTNQTQER